MGDNLFEGLPPPSSQQQNREHESEQEQQSTTYKKKRESSPVPAPAPAPSLKSALKKPKTNPEGDSSCFPCILIIWAVCDRSSSLFLKQNFELGLAFRWHKKCSADGF